MAQLAALYVTAYQSVEDATTYGARQYYLGVRDAFEATFLACHGVPSDSDTLSEALLVLAELDDAERAQVLHVCRATLRASRASTMRETLTAV